MTNLLRLLGSVHELSETMRPLDWLPFVVRILVQLPSSGANTHPRHDITGRCHLFKSKYIEKSLHNF
jgi:hypothetical protein